MTFLRQLFRRDESANPIRESAAMTTVYLLEMNRRFELFVLAKIEELEGVVTGLEARAASQRESWRAEWDVPDELDEAGQAAAGPSEVIEGPVVATDTANDGETVAFDPTADDEIWPEPETGLDLDDVDSEEAVAFAPATEAEDYVAASPLPEVAVGYKPLRSDDNHPEISLIDPTADAADEAGEQPAAGTGGSDDDEGEDIAATDDETAPLPPWMESMGVGVKGAYE
ncbi:MAG: hypothetical protein Kow0031_22260 [Anaerolineae bacterium]